MVETKLFPHVLEPGDINVFTNISTERNDKELDILTNKVSVLIYIVYEQKQNEYRI